MKGKNIVHFVTHNEKQANYVERFIKTLKSRIHRYMIEKNTHRYIDVLQKIVTSYNYTWYSGIRSEPVNVNKQNEKQLWWQMYWPKEPYVKKKKKEKIKFDFNVGDRVRTTYIRKPFSMNMILSGLEKFLKFQEDSFGKANLFTYWLTGMILL